MISPSFLRVFALIIFVLPALLIAQDQLTVNGSTCAGNTGSEINESDYVLVWADEFSEDGAICSDNWFHQTKLPNGTSWWNGELQHYTDRLDNSFVESGLLKIVAKKETFTDQGETKEYTSARLNSKYAFTYGKVEVKAKLPAGDGTWPAIWTLGRNITENGGYWADQYGATGWPACGEIDIMEHWGNNPNVIQSALHTPSSSGNTENKGSIIGSDVSNTFHVYSMIWSPDKIDFFLDGTLFYTYSPSDKNSSTWPFTEPQYILLNIAMGGVGGTIDPDFSESTMEIDYVRVYRKIEAGITLGVDTPLVKIYNNGSLINIEVDNSMIGSRLTIVSIGGKKIMDHVVTSTRDSMVVRHEGLVIVKMRDPIGRLEAVSKLMIK